MKKHFRKLHTHKLKSFLYITLFAIGGVLLLRYIAAAPNLANFEAENATLSANASVVNDASASGGRAVQFNQATNNSTPLQRAMANAPYYGAALYWPNAGTNFLTEYNTHVQRVGLGKKPDMLRVFLSDTDGTWTWSSLAGGSTGRGSPTLTGHDAGVWVSFKTDLVGAANGTYNANWTNSIKSIPSDGRPKIITIHHEPENDLPSTNYDTWVLNWIKANVNIGKAIKAANHPDVMVAPVFMSRYYIDGVAQTHPSNLHRWMKLAEDNGLKVGLNEAWDAIGWDPYHEGSADDPPRLTSPRDTAGYYFDVPFNFTQQYFPGKAFGIGETGYINRINESTRIAWLNSVKAWVDSKAGMILAVCYYDASLTGSPNPWYLSVGPGGTLTEAYQKSPAEFWGSLYR